MIQFNNTVAHALEGLTYLAAQPPRQPVASHVIAAARGLPERFLLKVFKPLVGAGVLVSVKGPNGGYRLGRPAKQVTILEAAQAADPSFLRARPTNGGALAPFLDRLAGQAAEAARQALASRTLADCLAEHRKATR